MRKQSVKTWVDRAENDLRKLGNRHEKMHDAAYMGTDLEFLGIPTPLRRTLCRKLTEDLPAPWEVCAKALWERPVLELRTMAIELAADYQDDFTKTHWSLFTEWLADCVGWAMVDTLCDTLIAPMIELYPEYAKQTTAWTKSKNLWLRRASLVAFCRPLREGLHDELAFAHAAALVAERDPMIYKAESWLLRSAIAHFRSTVEDFLKRHADDLAPQAIREVQNKLKTGTKSGHSHRK